MAENNMVVFKKYLNSEEIKQRLEDTLQDGAKSFSVALLNLFTNDVSLQACTPDSIIKSALLSATLRLPIDKALGFAYVLPYKNGNVSVATFQMGAKGYTQLAIRSGSYKKIITTAVYADEFDHYNPFEDELIFTDHTLWKDRDTKDAEKIVGFYAKIELLNGFSKSMFMTKAEMDNHADNYSQAKKNDNKYGNKKSIWNTNFVAMGEKTVLKLLISKFGTMSVDIQKAINFDQATVGGDFDNLEPQYPDNEPIKPEAQQIPMDEMEEVK